MVKYNNNKLIGFILIFFMHLTLETELGVNNLIINDFPRDEYADFLS